MKSSLACCPQILFCSPGVLGEQKIKKVGWKESVKCWTVFLFRLKRKRRSAIKCFFIYASDIKGHVQVIVSEPRVLCQSQPIICGSRFSSDAKISPGNQRISTGNVELLIELVVRACAWVTRLHLVYKQYNWTVDGVATYLTILR